MESLLHSMSGLLLQRKDVDETLQSVSISRWKYNKAFQCLSTHPAHALPLSHFFFVYISFGLRCGPYSTFFSVHFQLRGIFRRFWHWHHNHFQGLLLFEKLISKNKKEFSFSETAFFLHISTHFPADRSLKRPECKVFLNS